ncbi:MAG TPA: DNA repair protein RecO [Spirochaetia bacterium]|nr:DNA repair protein RecO [Spirochaetia bacterium]
MYRNISTQAIVIRRERLGEFHKSLVLLTSDMGLVRAVAYGAYRMNSSLRMGSEPFTVSQARLYCNPVKQSYKVTELEIRQTFESLLKDFSRVAAASLWAEVALKSYAAGETSNELFELFRGCLHFLEQAEAKTEAYVTIQFLWRFLSLAGYQPAAESCCQCGAPFRDRSASFSPAIHGFLCSSCAPTSARSVPAGALRYLAATGHLQLSQAVDVTLEPAGLSALRHGLPLMVQAVLEGELVTLRAAGAAL